VLQRHVSAVMEMRSQSLRRPRPSSGRP
jgi:hypothetical protein